MLVRSAELNGPLLLEGQGLRFVARPGASPQQFQIKGKSLYLRGTKQLIDALVFPALHLSAGQLRLLGQPAAVALRTGQVGLCPSKLPVALSTRLFDALLTSARLMGRGAVDVDRSLDVVGLAAHKKTRVEELNPEQHRRSGIAHGLLTEPSLLIFVQPFADLGDQARILVSQVMERVALDRKWIVGGEASCAVSRAWQERAEWFIHYKHDHLEAERAPLPSISCYFLTLDRTPAEISAELRAQGGTVSSSENPQVLLISGLSEGQIRAICQQFSECTVTCLMPAEEGGFRNSHARSAL
jgi:hypothetical protein